MWGKMNGVGLGWVEWGWCLVKGIELNGRRWDVMQCDVMVSDWIS